MQFIVFVRFLKFWHLTLSFVPPLDFRRRSIRWSCGVVVQPCFKTVQYTLYWTMFLKLSNIAFREGNRLYCPMYIYIYTYIYIHNVSSNTMTTFLCNHDKTPFKRPDILGVFYGPNIPSNNAALLDYICLTYSLLAHSTLLVMGMSNWSNT